MVQALQQDLLAQQQLRQASEAEVDRLSGLLADAELGDSSTPHPAEAPGSQQQLQEQAGLMQVKPYSSCLSLPSGLMIGEVRGPQWPQC